jgi:hypothetical protein
MATPRVIRFWLFRNYLNREGNWVCRADKACPTHPSLAHILAILNELRFYGRIIKVALLRVNLADNLTIQ